MDEKWRIELFGGVVARRGDQTLKRLETRGATVLLGFLACHLGRRCSRKTVMEQLWPGVERAEARNLLNQAFTTLLRALEEPIETRGQVLLADRRGVGLRPDAVITDVREFEALLRLARQSDAPDREAVLTEAVALYRDGFLSGYQDAWAVPERFRLEKAYREALRLLAHTQERSGAYRAAIETTRRLIARDRFDEPSYRDLMKYYAAAGETAQALRCYAELEHVLRTEQDVATAPETLALAEELRHRSPSGALTSGSASGAAALLASGVRADRRSTFPNSEERSVAVGLPGPAGPGLPSRLPASLTRFFGREADLQRIASCLSPSEASGAQSVDLRHPAVPAGIRLLTLTGPGGAGKTRLALEAALRMHEAFCGAVWFVPLADLTDASRILDCVVDALRVPRAPESRPQELLLGALSMHPSALLILDNFEQLVEEGAPVIQDLLEQLTSLKCLVTSRRRLEVAGELEHAVQPLPAPHEPDSPDRLMAFPSVQLFVDRAQAARSEFRLTEENASAVTALCARLEGIPLAIELAAAWGAVLTPAQMVLRLARRFELLVSRYKGTDARHRSLRAAQEVSYRLLSASLKQRFLCLSVFQGGWTLEAAREICLEESAESDLAAGSSLYNSADALIQLRDRSLIVAEETGEGMRYRMLETLREFAGEKLSVDLAEDRRIRRRHAAYYIRLAERYLGQIRTPDEGTALRLLERDIDNLRAAMDWAKQAGEQELFLRLALYLGMSLQRFGLIREPVVPIEAGLEAARGAGDRESDVYASLLMERAGLHLDSLEPVQARACAQEANALYARGQDALNVARARILLGSAAKQERDYRAARACFRQALQEFEKQRSEKLAAIVHNNLGLLEGEHIEGSKKQAYYHMNEALRLRRTLGDRRGTAESVNNLGVIAQEAGDWEQAERCYAEALRLELAMRHTFGVARALSNLGETAFARGAAGQALRLFAAAERLFDEIRSPYTRYTADWLHRVAADLGMQREVLASQRDGLKAWNLERLAHWATGGEEA